MAKIVYDPSENRKQKNVKVFSEAPKTIVYDSKVPPKGKAAIKKETKAKETEKPKTVEPEKSKEKRNFQPSQQQPKSNSYSVKILERPEQRMTLWQQSQRFSTFCTFSSTLFDYYNVAPSL